MVPVTASSPWRALTFRKLAESAGSYSAAQRTVGVLSHGASTRK